MEAEFSSVTESIVLTLDADDLACLASICLVMTQIRGVPPHVSEFVTALTGGIAEALERAGMGD